MKLFIGILLLIVIGHYSYKFVQLIVKMKQEIILPTTNEEIAVFRKYPQKTVEFPTHSSQKVGIIIYSIMLFFIIGMLLFVSPSINHVQFSMEL